MKNISLSQNISNQDHIKLISFNSKEICIVNDAVSMAEDLTSNFYKMSASQWLALKYDIKTLSELCEDEIVHGPFAQVIRYEAKRKGTSLGTSTYDFYKICLQDHAILSALKNAPDLKLFPFILYIVIHELVHIVRFCKFLQNFDASPDEKTAEEIRVHQKTREILHKIQISGTKEVLKFYQRWCDRHELVDTLR